MPLLLSMFIAKYPPASTTTPIKTAMRIDWLLNCFLPPAGADFALPLLWRFFFSGFAPVCLLDTTGALVVSFALPAGFAPLGSFFPAGPLNVIFFMLFVCLQFVIAPVHVEMSRPVTTLDFIQYHGNVLTRRERLCRLIS